MIGGKGGEGQVVNWPSKAGHAPLLDLGGAGELTRRVPPVGPFSISNNAHSMFEVQYLCEAATHVP